ncbi:MAG TPA: tetratricopeptide repeat protein, partial [Elusimicrobiota bacterium]|nr:tetratricopeptide repeat protein [Elusimicrobiota bacterium]
GLQGDVMQAEEFFHKALRLLEQNRGAQCPELAGGLNDLAALYYDHSHYKEAEPLLRQAIDILQTVFGPAHPEVSTGLNNLMMCLQSLGRSVETEGLKQQLIERARHLGR